MLELEPAPSTDRYVLLLDQGNSRVKWISAVWTAKTHSWNPDMMTFGEGQIGDLEAALGSGEMMPPEEVLYCSVANESLRTQTRKVIEAGSSVPVTMMTPEASTRGITNGYVDFQQLGADRWMAVVGAATHYSLPLVVMDLGTATTLDYVDHEGNHQGGLILPGPQTMLESLGGGTAMSVDETVSISETNVRPGKPQSGTDAAITGGALSAQLGALDQFLASLDTKAGTNPQIIVTGGAAGAILGKSDHALTHDPLLVFKGMLICRYGADNRASEDNA